MTMSYQILSHPQTEVEYLSFQSHSHLQISACKSSSVQPNWSLVLIYKSASLGVACLVSRHQQNGFLRNSADDAATAFKAYCLENWAYPQSLGISHQRPSRRSSLLESTQRTAIVGALYQPGPFRLHGGGTQKEGVNLALGIGTCTNRSSRVRVSAGPYDYA